MLPTLFKATRKSPEPVPVVVDVVDARRYVTHSSVDAVVYGQLASPPEERTDGHGKPYTVCSLHVPADGPDGGEAGRWPLAPRVCADHARRQP